MLAGFVISSFARDGLVLCVHEDGRQMIEMAAAPCCMTGESGESLCGSDPGDPVTRDGLLSHGDPCQDYPLTLLLPQCGSDSTQPALPAMQGPFVADGPTPPAPAFNPALEKRGLSMACGPPSAGTLTHLYSVVLRC